MSNPVTPVSGNNCIGTHYNGSVDRRFKCVKEYDNDGSPVYACTTMKYFYVTCEVNNQLCNSLSGGYVAAVTVCNQRLF